MKSQFAEAVTQALEKKSMSVRDLQRKLDIGYEHTRRLTKGLSFPSKYLLKVLCTVLERDEKDISVLITADKLQYKYGGIPAELTGKTERVTRVEQLLNQLTESEYKMVIDILQGLIRRHYDDAVDNMPVPLEEIKHE